MRKKLSARRKTTLIAGTVVCLILVAIVVSHVVRANRQRAVAELLSKHNAQIAYDCRIPRASMEGSWAWMLADWLGEDMVGRIVDVAVFPNENESDADEFCAALGELASLGTVESLDLYVLNDCCIEKIGMMSSIRELTLGETSGNISFNLAPLSKLKQLRYIRLAGKGITPAKIASLASIPNLKELNLAYTDADDNVVDALLSLPTLEELSIDYSDISIAGTKKLAQSPRLKVLWTDEFTAKSLEKSGATGTVQVKFH